MLSDEDDLFVTNSLAIYSSLNFKPPSGKFTILASFALTSANNLTPPKVIALSTGSKCLPEVRLPLKGDTLHDSHAEVLARRCAVRWFLEEIARFIAGQKSQWIERHLSGKFSLKEGIRMIMYISTVPCGDASMRYLASSQDDEMAALKNSTVSLHSPPNTASRGRDNYSLYGVLRTKPGRADSPPTLSMSCSDKIATWNAIGIQGALGSRFFRPIYISKIIIGEVDEGMQELVRADCKRAFWERLESIHDFPADYQLHRSDVQFTTVIFPHSRTSLTPPPNSSCNESVCWIADSAKTHEVLISGGKRGVPPKYRYKAMFKPQLSKISLFQLYRETINILELTVELDQYTYHRVKKMMVEYQIAKQCLQASGRPFSGWIQSGERWESFDSSGMEQKQNIQILD